MSVRFFFRFSRSDRSVRVTFTPNLVMPWFSRAYVQPYRVSSATISSPATTELHSAEEMAPMPEAAAMAASPPSREASFSSTAPRVGLPRRE